MLLELKDPLTEFGSSASDARAPVVGALPAGLVFTERACGLLRAFLQERGLDEWKIFSGHHLDIADIDYHFEAVGDADACWVPAGALSRDGEAMLALEQSSTGLWLASGGFLHLKNRSVVVARWAWIAEHDGSKHNLYLAAAPSARQFADLRERISRQRRTWSANVWQFVSGYSNRDGPRTPRAPVDAQSLFLPVALRDRLRSDVVSFFSEPVAALYKSLEVPYRRGVLLHGPPGNGKTSLIRLLGAELPSVPFMVLRADNSFDADDFSEIVRRWKALAPAVLVIEDLNWLLKIVNISMFLNLLDGIDDTPSYAAGTEPAAGATGGGLMLIATTNDPAALDPAINNRPGRFDVVIEITSPDDQLRGEFLQAKLPALDAGVLKRVVSLSRGFSFAHLQELLRLSGLFALASGRSARSGEDVLRAAEDIRRTQEQAQRGFPPPTPDLPFGLQHLRTLSRE
jgi:hypothetical protein